MSVLDDHAEILFRHVSPSWLVEGTEPSSQAFRPFRAVDVGMLSSDRGSLTTADDALTLFITPKPNGFSGAAIGTWGVSVGEVVVAGLSAKADPVAQCTETPANPAHALVDFSATPEKNWKSLSQKLKHGAVARGCLASATKSC